MAQAKWRLEGEWMKNCNCAFGCPCDFNAKPTHGHCEGLLGMRITHGPQGGAGTGRRSITCAGRAVSWAGVALRSPTTCQARASASGVS